MLFDLQTVGHKLFHQAAKDAVVEMINEEMVTLF